MKNNFIACSFKGPDKFVVMPTVKLFSYT